ncbi:MAG: hypothetical protein HFH06_04620 [Lachnospiraceae bacterium]|nr:hypothetical protein [Lachnospiraceae bacterium]
MDKYEYKIRADEIKDLIARGEYAQAVDIADTIDWRRVKSVMMLCTISDLYKINRRYEDARNMLLLAYERRPGGRTICYSLCELSIKMEDFVPAVNYYKEFVQVAPKDPGRYILQYKLYEAQDVSLEERIGVLEELKKRDYREKWAYELAYLYHRVGLATRCVEECDELILWFGEGKYVIKAMELKMLHQPLSPSQQEKYDHRFEGYGQTNYEVQQGGASEKEPYYASQQEQGQSGQSYYGSQQESGYGEQPYYGSRQEPGLPEQLYYGSQQEPGLPEQPYYGSQQEPGLPEQLYYGSQQEPDLPEQLYYGSQQEPGLPEQPYYGSQQEPGLPEQPYYGSQQEPGLPEQPYYGSRQEPGLPEQPYYGSRQEPGLPEQPYYGSRQEPNLPEQPYYGSAQDSSLQQSYYGTQQEPETQEEFYFEPETPVYEFGGKTKIYGSIDENQGLPHSMGQETLMEQELFLEQENTLNQSFSGSTAEEVPQQPEELDIQVKTLDMGQYNTINLQAEIAAGLKEVLEEDQKAAKGEEITRSIVAPMIDSETESLDLPEIDEVDENDLGPETEVIEESEVFFGETAEIGNLLAEQEAMGERSAKVIVPEIGSVKQPVSGADFERETVEEVFVEEPVKDVFVKKGAGAEAAASPPKTDITAETVMMQLKQESEAEEQALTAQPPKEIAGVLLQESDGQISLVVPEREQIEKQITGQMNLDDILKEWERIKQENAERRKEEVRQHVLQHTGEMFTAFEASIRDGLLEKLEGNNGGAQASGDNASGARAADSRTAVDNGSGTGKPVAESLPEEPEEDFAADNEDWDSESGDGIEEELAEAEKEFGTVPEETEPSEYYAMEQEEYFSEEPEQTFRYGAEKTFGEEPEPPDNFGAEETYEFEEERQEAGYADTFEEEAEGELSEGFEEEAEGELSEGFEEEAEGELSEGFEEEAEGELSEGFEEEAEAEFSEDFEEEAELTNRFSEEPSAGFGEESDYNFAEAPKEPEQASELQEPEKSEEERNADGLEEKAESEQTITEPKESDRREKPAGQTRKAAGQKQNGNTVEKSPKERKEHSPVEREKGKLRNLTREERELYASYIQSRTSKEQIIQAVDNISMAAYTGNIIITGEEGMDTVTLAKNMIREVQMTDSNFAGKVAKISGQSLNKNNVESTLNQLASGALIIQKASFMEEETAKRLYKALQQDSFGIIIVLEDSKKAMNKFLEKYPKLAACFTARVDVEALSNGTLVAFGRKYAREKEYSIDDMGILALHTRIDEMQTIDHAVTVLEVKKLVDDAIKHANKKNLKHFFDILLAKRYDEEDMIILSEKDFAK